VSVLGNLLPAETKALVAAALGDDVAAARNLHHRLLPVMDVLFLESNPIPLKAALAAKGLMSDALRLPLVPASAATRDALAAALRAFEARHDA